MGVKHGRRNYLNYTMCQEYSNLFSACSALPCHNGFYCTFHILSGRGHGLRNCEMFKLVVWVSRGMFTIHLVIWVSRGMLIIHLVVWVSRGMFTIHLVIWIG